MVKYFVFFLIFSISPILKANEISAYLDKSEYSLGESVNLYIEIKNSKNYSLNLDKIENKFQIISKRKISSRNVVNGKVNSYETIALKLDIKEAGSYVIPSVTLKEGTKVIKTEEIFFKINADNSLNAKYSNLFSASYKLDKEKIYISENLILSITLTKKTNNIANEAFIPPKSDDFLIERIGDAKTTNKVIKGQKATIVEINYLLIPLKTGEAIIDLGKYELGMIDYNINNDPFSSFIGFSPSNVKNVVFPLSKEPLKLKILPLEQPLPILKNASMTSSSNKSKGLFGDPIEYIIKITANNIKSKNIPEIILEDDNFKIYAEEEINNNKFDRESLSYIATKTRKFILIPEKTGLLNLPQYNFSWFDKEEQKIQTIKTEEKQVSIENTNKDLNNDIIIAQETPQAEQEKEIPKKDYNFLIPILAFICLAEFFYILRLKSKKTLKDSSKTKLEKKENYEQIKADDYAKFVKKTTLMIHDKYKLKANSLGNLLNLIEKDNNNYEKIIRILKEIETTKFSAKKIKPNYENYYKILKAEFLKLKNTTKKEENSFNLNP